MINHACKLLLKADKYLILLQEDINYHLRSEYQHLKNSLVCVFFIILESDIPA